MKQSDHERLDVYHAAIEFLAVADEIAAQLPRGRRYLTDQLRRAAASIPLNIAEGAGEFASREKARFYRMARRSATESAAVLDVCVRLELITSDSYARGRAKLLPVVGMLVRMITNLDPKPREGGQEDASSQHGA